MCGPVCTSAYVPLPLLFLLEVSSRMCLTAKTPHFLITSKIKFKFLNLNRNVFRTHSYNWLCLSLTSTWHETISLWGYINFSFELVAKQFHWNFRLCNFLKNIWILWILNAFVLNFAIFPNRRIHYDSRNLLLIRFIKRSRHIGCDEKFWA